MLQHEVAGLEKTVTDLLDDIKNTKGRWKKLWEQELQNIGEEQQFLKQQEQLIGDLDDEQAGLAEVMAKIAKVSLLKARRISEPLDWAPPPLPEDLSEKDLRRAMLTSIESGPSLEERSMRRLKAMEEAERVRNGALFRTAATITCTFLLTHRLIASLSFFLSWSRTAAQTSAAGLCRSVLVRAQGLCRQSAL